VFGMLVAASFVMESRRRLAQAGLAALIIGAMVPLYWAPWSVQWLTHKAYDMHAAAKYSDAIDYYSRIIQREPGNAWAYINRSLAYQALGDSEKANADRSRALELDPEIEKNEK
jgi:tetratricopeptide (TPR) repeat protein